ncbi:MAG: hypothetical protein ACP5U1_11395 [Desulfomonilaceae bacterium]
MKTITDKPDDQSQNPVICYCFGYNRRDIEEDFVKNGKSFIAEKISAEKRQGRCQCASKNPSGK